MAGWHNADIKKVKGLPKEHICIDADNSVVMAREKGIGGCVEVTKERERSGDIFNNVKNKNKVKKKKEIAK